jgi:hypothetical protein
MPSWGQGSVSVVVSVPCRAKVPLVILRLGPAPPLVTRGDLN